MFATLSSRLQRSALGRSFLAAALYLGLTPVAAVLGFVGASVAGMLGDALPGALGNAFYAAANLVAPALAGGLLYYAYARRGLERFPTAATLIGWLIRVTPLVVLGTAAAHRFVTGFKEPGFGLVAQLILWPAAALWGGVVGDAVATVLARRGRTRDTASTAAAV